MMDIGTLFNEDNGESERGSKVDLSGKKIPKNVRVILNSGIEVQCDVKYDGLAEDDPRMRRYKIIGEIDWHKHWVKSIIIGELPLDVRIALPIPETTSAEHRAYASQMTNIVEKRV